MNFEVNFEEYFDTPFWPPANVDGDLSSDMLRYCSCIRRPSFLLRGAPVSPELAREIIARTDDSLYDLDPPEYWEELWEDRLRSGRGMDVAAFARSGAVSYFAQCHFSNWWFGCGHSPMGWCHFDGTIGKDDVTAGKYPTMSDYICDWAPLAAAYPQLELMVLPLKLNEGVLNWSHYPFPCVHAQDTDLVEHYADAGFHIHDGRMTLLPAKDAFRLFLDFQARYPYSEADRSKDPVPDRDKFLVWAKTLSPIQP